MPVEPGPRAAVRGAGAPYRVSFVCSGNICRSPIGEAVLSEMLRREGLAGEVTVDSYGTGPWHVGAGADARALRVLRHHGYDGSAHRARQISAEMLAAYDLVLAMDSGHRRELHRLSRRVQGVRRPDIELLRSFDPAADSTEVDDPYFGDDADFDRTLREIEAACAGVLARVRSLVSG